MRAVDSVRHTRATPAGRDVTGSVFGTMTAGAWTLYAYLWLPAITLVAWGLGLRTAWVQNVLERASVDVGELWVMGSLVVLLGCTLVLWAEQQRRRFGGVERRRRAVDVAPAAVASSLGVTPEVLHGLQVARVATVHLDADGRPVRVVAGAPGAGAAAGVPAPRRGSDDLARRG